MDHLKTDSHQSSDSSLRLPHIPTWAVFALGGLLVILAPAALALPRYTTSNYQYCLTCHGGGDTPNRGIESKVHPPFEQVGCTDCHAEPGQVVYEGYRQGFGSEPERVSPNCVSCHRDITRQNDQVGFKKNVLHIQVPHKLHYELGAKCTDCHANVAHDLKVPQTNRPRMEYCSQCHATTTEACTKCHADGVPPGPIPSAPPAGMVADGRALYSRYCSECHGQQGDRVASVNLLSNEYLTKQGFFDLERMASEGHGGMPAFGKARGGPLTDDEIRAIIAHLKLAAEGPGQARGDLLYDKDCAVCHGAKGDKMPLVNLSSAAFMGSLKVGAIAQAINEGKGGMPAFGKLRGGPLSFDEMVAIERFVTTMVPKTGAAAPTAIPHDLAGRDDCLACHSAGGFKPVPTDHQGRTKEVCQACHQPVGAAPSPPAKAIPHSLAGRDNCLACHAPGGLKPAPASHQGRTSDLCQTCHKAAIELAGPTPTPAAGPPASVAPAIPHPIAGETNCLACHASGGLKPVPPSHVGRSNDVCQVCHASR